MLTKVVTTPLARASGLVGCELVERGFGQWQESPMSKGRGRSPSRKFILIDDPTPDAKDESPRAQA